MAGNSIDVADNEIVEGTSLFISATNEVIWVTEINAGFIDIETVSASGTIPRDQFAERLQETTFDVEHGPQPIESV